MKPCFAPGAARGDLELFLRTVNRWSNDGAVGPGDVPDRTVAASFAGICNGHLGFAIMG
ncbi:MAG: hypothetical protein IID39_08335 [Planctomycetes bacterium]|nr:hypothetical protein [Planctomycetota bacterium]